MYNVAQHRGISLHRSLTLDFVAEVERALGLSFEYDPELKDYFYECDMRINPYSNDVYGGLTVVFPPANFVRPRLDMYEVIEAPTPPYCTFQTVYHELCHARQYFTGNMSYRTLWDVELEVHELTQAAVRWFDPPQVETVLAKTMVLNGHDKCRIVRDYGYTPYLGPNYYLYSPHYSIMRRGTSWVLRS